ncbi:unnamed protein product [Durusdinium trenchii]|uniref:Uncharacterized protein n=2 Tax=Durusdinium trenchii TaxID=1381693 RepID=A0ABP0KEG6_9DINO
MARPMRRWALRSVQAALALLLVRFSTESWVPGVIRRPVRGHRVRCAAEEGWQMPNPFAGLQGSMADPGYWKQQHFLAGNLKQLLPPSRDEFIAMQLAPNDCKYLGYLAPQQMPGKDAGEKKLLQYLVLGPVSGIQKYEFEKQCKVYSVAAGFRDWEKNILNLVPKPEVHVGVVAAGTAARLGGRILREGLLQLAAALTRDGRILLIVNEEDEKVIGGKLEDVMEAQEWQELMKSGDLPPDPEKEEMAEVLEKGKLRLVRVQRDECGLAVGVCAGLFKPKVVKRPKAAAAKASAGSPREKKVRRPPRGKR